MFEFKFADIGEGITEGKVFQIEVEEGEDIKEGQTIMTVETDKVTAELPSPIEGRIGKIFVSEGDVVNVGEVLVQIEEQGEKTQGVDSKGTVKETGVVGHIEVSSEIIQPSSEGVKEAMPQKHKVLATPVARKLAKELEVDINAVEGTGEAGRVMKEDIYRAKEKMENGISISGATMEGSHEGPVERMDISMTRKTIAKNMSLSKSKIPHATSIDEIDVTRLVEFKNENSNTAREKGVKLTYMPFIIKAAAHALREHPRLNSSYDEEGQQLVIKKYFNIGIAVDTEDGLVVPVIKNADKKGIFEIAKELEDMAEKARGKKLDMGMLKGGTFSITNYGSAGTLYGVPVIKYPETAILGVGRIVKKPVVIGDKIEIRDIMTISVSIDHRVIDGADAARFSNSIKENLGDPMLLLLK